MGQVLEIRSYRLVTGMRDQLHQLMCEQALPMLKRWGVDVVAFGPSMQDEDSYYLMRAYDGLEDLQESQDAFYGSDEWREGPREAILACIERYGDIVIEVSEEGLGYLRQDL